MAAAFDFKKEYQDLYLPRALPMLIDVPTMTFVAVAGSGNPNEDNGDYAGSEDQKNFETWRGQATKNV